MEILYTIFGVFLAIISIITISVQTKGDVQKNVNVFSPIIGAGIIGVVTHYVFYDMTAFSTFLLANPFYIVVFLIAYIAIGTAYVLFYRYKEFVKENSDHIKQLSKDYRIKKQNASVSEIISSEYYMGVYGPKNNKSRITNWIVWWPFSMISHLMHKPIEMIIDKCYDFIMNIGINTGTQILSDVDVAAPTETPIKSENIEDVQQVTSPPYVTATDETDDEKYEPKYNDFVSAPAKNKLSPRKRVKINV